MRLMIDTNVILDVLLERLEWLEFSQKVLYLVADEVCEGFVTANSVTDIYYNSRKKYGDEAIKEAMKVLFNQLFIVDTTRKDCLWALQSPVKDYEDAVLVEAAARAGMDAIVTRDKKDFKGVALQVWTPEETVKKLG